MSAGLTLSLTTVLAIAQVNAALPQEKVMILGVYHFDSPNLDFVKSTKVDHLNEAKQDEIAEVLLLLAGGEVRACG